MERLTKRNEDGSVGISEFRYYNYRDFQKFASKLAEYEDIGTVEEFEKMKILFGNDDIKVSEVVNKILKEYFQYKIIGTIEELKAIKSDGFTDHLLNMGFTKGYRKAIDDFAEEIMICCSMSDMNKKMIKLITEKLKKEV